MQVFIVSIFAGICFPILPIVLEFGITTGLKLETLAVTAVVYAAAVGLVSRYQAIAIAGLFFSTLTAVIYALDMADFAKSHPGAYFIRYGDIISMGTIYFFALCYAYERFGRHVIENEPFLEF
jgi:hypothetical protein